MECEQVSCLPIQSRKRAKRFNVGSFSAAVGSPFLLGMFSPPTRKQHCRDTRSKEAFLVAMWNYCERCNQQWAIGGRSFLIAPLLDACTADIQKQHLDFVISKDQIPIVKETFEITHTNARQLCARGSVTMSHFLSLSSLSSQMRHSETQFCLDSDSCKPMLLCHRYVSKMALPYLCARHRNHMTRDPGRR